MHSKLSTTQLLAGCLIAGGALVASSCAQQVGDIDRTQPNRLEKADFNDGAAWAFRQTIADVPSTNAFFFTGISSSTEKVRWEITKDSLIAYRSYELVPGTEEGATTNGQDDVIVAEGSSEGFLNGNYKGSPVMAYGITSHFDVQRSYSSSTGEQSNVIVENGSDRYWNDRDYMRVNWASQRLSNINLFYPHGTIQYNHFYGDEDPTAQTIKMERDENGQLTYLEFTTKAIVVPSYACYYYYEADCGPTEVEVVNSFVRQAETPDYEAIQYDNTDMNKFGYFRDERVTYDRKRGVRRSSQIFLPTRHNIFETAYDANGNLIPMKDRKLKPVVYYLNKEMPAELDTYNKRIEEEWDKAFTQAAELASGQKPDHKMFVVCHNPVQESDDAACGDVGLEVGVGDLRYNHIYWAPDPALAGPLGHGPNASDPETGEIYSGTAYVYGASVDRTATYAMDLVKFVLACEDGENSAECTEHRQAVIGGDDVRSDIISRLNGVDPRAREGGIDARLSEIEVPNSFEEMLDIDSLAKIQDVRENPLPFDPGFEQRRVNTIREQGYDLMMLDAQAVRDLTGGQYSNVTDIPADVLEEIRPANWLTASRIKNFDSQRQSFFAQNNIMHSDALEGELIGLVDSLVNEAKEKNLDAGEIDEFMWQKVRGLIYQGVMLHEIGHTLGLRHNFQGSYDSLNYHDPYWRLRKETMKEIELVSDLFEASTLTDNQRRGKVVEDGNLVEQLEGGIAEYQFSTVMDYGHHSWGDTQGIGKYDLAAIVYAYTAGYNGEQKDGKAVADKGFVQIFSDRAFADATEDGDRTVVADLIRDFDDRGSLAYTGMLEGFHYLTVANMFGDPENIKERDWMRYDELLEQRADEDEDRAVEVPFMFCTDDWVGVDSSCHRWDAGADPYEQAIHAVNRYRNYYPMTNFARDSLTWSPFNKVSSTYGRIFSILGNIYQQLFFGGDFDGIQSTYRWMAANVGLNLTSEVMLTPNYGEYVMDKDGVLVHCWDANNDVFTKDGQSVTTSALCYGDSDMGVAESIDYELPMGMGRYPFNRFDYDSGYAYYQYPTEAGHFYDYLAAVLAMTSSQAIVRGVDTRTDGNAYSLPYFLQFDNAITDMFNSIWLERPAEFAPRVMMAEDKLIARPLSPVAFGSLSVDPETGAPLDTEFNIPDDIDPALAPRVQPYHSWGMRFYPMLYGMAFFTSNYSLQYADNNQVFRLGSGETMQPGPGFDVVTCTDPLNGHNYSAVRNLSSLRKSGAVQLVESCKEMSDEYVEARRRLNFNRAAELERDISGMVVNLNIMRGFYDAFGRAF